MGLKSIGKALKTSWRKRLGSSDIARWGKSESLSSAWDARTEKLAAMIPQGASVLEFGAGRMALRRYLPSSTAYTPSDLVDRGAGTLVCDLNAKELPPLPPHDVAVFSGVLEYVHDAPRLVAHLAPCVRAIVASYAVTEGEPSAITRRNRGWTNDYSADQFEAIFASCGFVCDLRDAWEAQKLYRFVKTGA